METATATTTTKMSANSGQTHGCQPQSESIDSIDSIRRASLARNRSFDDMGTLAEAKVLVIYTGGTIGMTRNSNNGKYFARFVVILNRFSIQHTFNRVAKKTATKRKE